MNSNLITASDVAKLFSVSPQRVYDLVRKKIIPRGVVVMVGPRQQRFDQDALKAWIAKGGFACATSNEKTLIEPTSDTVTPPKKRVRPAA